MFKGQTSNLVGGWIMCYQLPWPAIKVCKVARWRGHTPYRVGRTRRPHNLYSIRVRFLIVTQRQALSFYLSAGDCVKPDDYWCLRPIGLSRTRVVSNTDKKYCNNNSNTLWKNRPIAILINITDFPSHMLYHYHRPAYQLLCMHLYGLLQYSSLFS